MGEYTLGKIDWNDPEQRGKALRLAQEGIVPDDLSLVLEEAKNSSSGVIGGLCGKCGNMMNETRRGEVSCRCQLGNY